MADTATDLPGFEEDSEPAPLRRRRWPWLLLAVLAIPLLALAYAWLSRERIAGDLIQQQLDRRGVNAHYTVERIGAELQVLRDVVIGDPAHPDLTIERIEARTTPRLGMPDVGLITLVRPRLYGSWRGGKLSFGKLDPLIFTGSKEPFRLPDYDVAVIDGRARLHSDFGPMGMKIEGQGRLRNGFVGQVAAIMPAVAAGRCRAGRTTIYGALSVSNEKPRFMGPVRTAGAACPAAGLRLGEAGMTLDAVVDPHLDGVQGAFSLFGRGLAAKGARLASSDIEASFAYRDRALSLRYSAAGKGLDTPQAHLAAIGTNGALRAQEQFSRIDSEGSFSGTGLRVGGALDAMLADAQSGARDTLAAPLFAQLRAALGREVRGEAALAGNYAVRHAKGQTGLTVPQAALRGGSGAALVSLSHLQATLGGRGSPQIAADFVTGGPGLPRIAGRAERTAAGGITTRLAMAEFASGDSRLEVPELVAVQAKSGSVGFAGRARLSGPLPGGRASNLALPVEGAWAHGSLAVWRKCTAVTFDGLSLAGLTLDRRGLTLCPPPGRAILAADARGARLAAGLPSLDVTGRLGDTPVRIASGPLGFAYPGTVSGKNIDFSLGDPRYPSRFRIAALVAQSGGALAGKFSGTQVLLDAVPLDVLEAGGDWRYDRGRLTVARASFRLKDRKPEARFEPLLASGATLQLAGDLVMADAMLRDPAGGRDIVHATIRHNLGNGQGEAQLAVPGIRFDKQLQPDQVTRLALGVVANARGMVNGDGRIAWVPGKVTSTGRFSTDGADFAAAFGPVKGISGAIVFTDLLGLVTAPDQRLRIAAINPGIEVNDGEMRFEMQPGNLLAIQGAQWPFLGGTLTLQPTRMRIGEAETRRLTFRIEGLDAAKFVQRMDMSNISATGIFDGSLPMVFDQNGGRIEHGGLFSRPPGGNVSYVGALSYKDMSTMANFAFDALKSMDYRQMQVELDGDVAGEMITRVSFDGIRQGQSAKRNFITRQIARLPIRFNVNLKAPFFKMVHSLRSLYDPDYVPDPRALGLTGTGGKPAVPGKSAPAPRVQPPVSGTKP